MARLTLIDGPSAGVVYDFEDACSIGRADDCAIRIVDSAISRHHVSIQLTRQGWELKHLGLNVSTFVNGMPVIHSTVLESGDVVRVDKVSMKFEAGRTVTEGQRAIKIPGAVTMLNDSYEGPEIVRSLSSMSSLLDDAAEKADPEIRKLSTGLKTIRTVSKAIGHILSVAELLPEILTNILEVFADASRATALIKEEGSSELVSHAFKSRVPKDEADAFVSSTVVNHVAQTRASIISRDAQVDSRFAAGVSIQLKGLRAIMCAPLVWRDQLLGALYLDSNRLGAFSNDDLELFNGIAEQCANALGVAQLHRELSKRERLEEDIRLAQQIQRSFLPRRYPDVPGYEFACAYAAAQRVGGDFYDFVSLGTRRLGVFVADVSGKGVSAALYMARFTRDLRHFALTNPDAGELLSLMNNAVLEGDRDNMFVTLIYLQIDLATGLTTIANAGHMPPIIRRAKQGVVEVLDRVSSMPLGLMPGTTFETDRFTLMPGDTVVLYTDGLTEAMNEAQEMFGMDRLNEVVGRGPSSAMGVLDRALTGVKVHAAGAAQFDDTTVVCVGRCVE